MVDMRVKTYRAEGARMAENRKSIKRSVLIGCTIFVVLLCLAFSLLSYGIFSSSLYHRYDAELESIVNYVESNVDADDLQQCVKSGKHSAKYDQLQQFLNGMIDEFETEYLYIVIPIDDETGTMMNVISATSEAERAAGEVDRPLLETTDAYSRETIQLYLKAWNTPGISYFEESSEWGAYYTACKPLVASDGEIVALNCADIPINELHEQVRNEVMMGVGLAIVLGLLFGALLIWWLQRNVTGPISELERSARQFADKSHDMKDLRLLTFEVPAISTGNEVESLAGAIDKLSEDMKIYVNEILSAEERVRTAEREAEGMTRMAYQDGLTHVKNKTAYDVYVAELEETMARQNIEFAVVMVDLNDLKGVNDTYGHDRGDQYIIGTCKIMSETLKHSPVFRIGGDEFVSILRGNDFERRQSLVGQLEDHYRESTRDLAREPWQRYSASVGMAVYDSSKDAGYTQVFNRADELMYERKKQLKEQG